MKKKLSLLSVLLAAACTVGPDYVQPTTPPSQAFKETGTWDPATPMDDINRGNWWVIYQDPILNNLESQIDISNQNLAQAEANYRAAVAIADQTRASLFPIISGTGGATRSGNGGSRGTSTSTTYSNTSYAGNGTSAANSYNLSAGASWTIDIWGRIRRQLESDEANAQASAADLASARLSAQSELATDYFALRVQDELQRLLDKTAADDQKIVTILQNQYNVGVAAPGDLLSAQTQMENAQAAATNTGIQRAQLEHAIAVLIGRAPSDFALGAQAGTGRIPVIPASVPSTLLQRRPDIASAERKAAAANAEIGVAVAAYYPQLTLSASYGVASTLLSNLVSATTTVWSFGASAADNIIDFGARDAATAEARANFDASVALYRQTVLTAFQNVEDNLAAQRILVTQEKQQAKATADAQKAEQIALNQYKEGIVPYNTVLTAQIVALGDEQASLTVTSNRLAASVALIEALGGGWDAKQLPDVSGPIIPNPL